LTKQTSILKVPHPISPRPSKTAMYVYSGDIGLKSIKIFSQKVCKNQLLTNTFLESCKDFDILFIQESP